MIWDLIHPESTYLWVRGCAQVNERPTTSKVTKIFTSVHVSEVFSKVRGVTLHILLGFEDLGPSQHRLRLSWGCNRMKKADIESKMVPGHVLQVSRGGLYCFQGWVATRRISTFWDLGSTLKVDLRPDSS